MPAVRARDAPRKTRACSCARISDDENEQPVEIQLLDRSTCERDVPHMRGIEGTAQDSYCHSSVSPSSSTSAPRLTPLGEAPPPAREQAAECRRRGSRGRCGGSEPRATPWLRPVLEVVGQLLVDERRRARRRAKLEERALEILDAHPGGARGRHDPHDALVSELERRGIRQQIHLVQNDDLLALVESRPVCGKLAVDRLEPLLEIALGRVEHMYEQRARSRCARNSCPRPAPSAAPSIRPGTSAIVSRLFLDRRRFRGLARAW